MKRLVVSYGGYCLFAAVCVWLFVPDPRPVTAVSSDDADNPDSRTIATQMKSTLSN